MMMSRMDERILYFMHVPWGWIKQRPHFIAEELSRKFEITVIYRKSYRKKLLVKNPQPDKLNLVELLSVPFKRKIKILDIIDLHLIRYQIKNLLKNYQIIWLTSPELYKYIHNYNVKSNQILVYDCMDDILEFPTVNKYDKIKKNLFKLEKELCQNATIIFCSSSYLKNKLIRRYKVNSNKIKVINNAIDLSSLSYNKLPQEIEQYFQTNKKKIIYIGTISEWFDFDLILYSLEKFKNIEYLLFGPADCKIPSHPSIKYIGPIQHKYISAVMKKADVLIMPFKVNELIRSVDPVKVYEYIFSGKPALVVEYEETYKFKDYIFLYSSPEDYIYKLNKILANNMNYIPTKEKIDEFVKNSQWQHRVSQIISYLKSKR